MSHDYLSETPLLDYQSPAIQTLIAQRGWTVLSDGERIGGAYDFVRNEILFGYNSDDALPASQVLADGYGQCNTKGTLLMALPPAERAAITNTGGFVDIPTPMLESEQSAKNRIAALLGGRAAEHVIFGEALNGAGLGDNSDLERATKLAGQMIFEWGLGGQRVFTPTPALIKGRTDLLDKILKHAERSAIQILTARKELISNIAVALRKERELSAQQIRRLLPPTQRLGATRSRSQL